MESESTGGANMPWAQGIVLALLLGVGSLFISESPYVSDRHAESLPRNEQRFGDQDVDARLWQDPLGVVQRAREAAADAGDPALHDLARLREAFAGKAADGNAAVLAVMLRGGPYSEHVEQRRRTRYAVLSGLGAMGYVPADSDHLGWIRAPREGAAAGQLPETIPYEWFGRDPDARKRLARVLVIWLDDRAFGSRPVERMSALAEALTPKGGAAPAGDWRILGPVRSDTLLAMAQEANASTGPSADYARLHFYAAAPTVSDRAVLGMAETGEPDQLLGRLFADRLGIQFTRTILNDAQLSHAIVDELRLRGIRAGGGEPADYGALCRLEGERVGAEPSHIAVVGELDTLYGRSLSRASQTSNGFCVDSMFYMRGLDGLLPDEAAGAAQGDDAKKAKGDTGADDRRKDGSFIERAEGQSQFDYLRRLAKQMRDRDAALREASPGGHGLQAIGVLGNDVHDKLLVIQALRPEFPTAIFFTTDLDARYLHPREQSWARNLIVASSFGLRLDDRLQGGIPPFRDAYQTSEFLATRLAVGDARRELAGRESAGTPRASGSGWQQEDVAAWLGRPRIFEIGRTGAFDFSGRDAAQPAPRLPRLAAAAQGASGPRPAKGENCRGERWLNCADVHPSGSRKAPAPDASACWIIGVLLASLWIPVMVTWRGGAAGLAGFFRSRDLAPAQRRGRAALLAMLVLLQFVVVPCALTSAWPAIAQWMTAQGKPLVFTEGISIWPTEFLRLSAFLLGGYLLLRGWRGLERNQEAISRKFFLQAPRAEIEASQVRAEPRLGWRTRLANVFRWDAVEPAGLVTEHATGLSPRVEELWQRHVVQNRFGARMTRSAAFTAATLALTVVVVFAFDEWSVVPQRGLLSYRVHQSLHMLVFLMLYLVVTFVADATALCVSFLRYLRGTMCLWPEAAILHYERELAFSDASLVKHWIDLQFVAARTAEVNRLVYYPFILLSLILLSRSPAFDNWQMPLSGKVLAASGALVAGLCAMALREAAERTRRTAIREIDVALLRANGRQGCGETQAKAEADADPCPPTPRQLELLREHAVELSRGAFAKWSQQPVLKAVLLPFATVGGSTLLDYLSLANL